MGVGLIADAVPDWRIALLKSGNVELR